MVYGEQGLNIATCTALQRSWYVNVLTECLSLVSVLLLPFFFYCFTSYSAEEIEELAKMMIGNRLVTKQTGRRGRRCDKVLQNVVFGCNI